ncbi:hypothetical protein X801_08014, partial [Opisthorchis viverrini]
MPIEVPQGVSAAHRTISSGPLEAQNSSAKNLKGRKFETINLAESSALTRRTPSTVKAEGPNL